MEREVNLSIRNLGGYYSIYQNSVIVMHLTPYEARGLCSLLSQALDQDAPPPAHTALTNAAMVRVKDLIHEAMTVLDYAERLSEEIE